MKKSVEKNDKGGWVMASAFIPLFLFWAGSSALRDFGAPAVLTNVLGSLCLIAMVILTCVGMLMMR